MMLTNWSGDVAIAEQGQWTRVTSLEQLAQCLEREEGKVRVLGSRYTYPAQLRCAPGTRALVLDLARHEERQVDGDHLRVTGDTPLEAVWQAFDDHGLEPDTCPPVITTQTAAGALSTGTHAQGLSGGTFADCVRAIELMDAGGTLHRLTVDDDTFDSAVLSLGCLGVIVGLELRGRPVAQWHCGRYTFPEDTLPERYADWNRDAAAAKCWWFPDQQVAHAWITHSDAHPLPSLGTASANGLEQVVARTRDRLLADIGDRTGRTPAARTLAKFLSQEDSKGTLREIFRNGIAAPQLNMEIAVPLTVFGEAFTALKETLRASPYRLHYPVILRTTGASRGHLSPTRGVPATYFGFVSYMNPEGSIGEARPLFDDIQRALYALGGRPHWGKYFTPELVRDTGTARFAHFREDAARFDPHGRFKNDLYWQTIGGDAG
jgi:FAD/FMN-containing dehydrogenase